MAIPTGYTFPRRQCPKCKQTISIAQFSKHEGTKACREIAKSLPKQVKPT